MNKLIDSIKRVNTLKNQKQKIETLKAVLEALNGKTA